jgi:hypothetical protein
MTTLSMTAGGHRAFRDYLALLERIVKDAKPR